MVRYLIGKEVLWSSLKEYLYMPKELVDNQTNTEEFISLINENSGMNISWLFKQFLYKAQIPTLIVKNRIVKNKNFIDIRWDERDFKMPIEIQYESYDGIRVKKLKITNKNVTMVIPKESSFVIDPEGWVLCKTTIVEN